MAIRTALLNGNNISRDTDFSKYIESVSEPGVIEGLEVSATKVGIGKARVPCERTNGETIYALVYNSSEVTISGNGDVYIQVSQTYIDNGELANEDGTGIATIQVGTMPSKNALKLATITSGTPTDARNMIPKLGELNTQIVSIFDELADLDERVEKLEEAGAVNHLEESGLVGELYTLNDKLFKQYTPTLADSTLDCNVSDVAANSQIHIQRIGTGVASNQLKLKVKMVGSSTQNLKVEVRKGVQVTVTANSEAYWYGGTVVASGSIPYSQISTNYAEKTVTLNNEFGGTKGELLDVVVYMDTVNATNYYCVACDSTQYSEGFSYVSVNGSTRARSKLMPYCISDGFAQSLFVKAKDGYGDILQTITLGEYSTQKTSYTEVASGNFTSPGYVKFSAKIRNGTDGILTSASISINGETFEDSTTGTAQKIISHGFGFQNKSNYSIKLKSGNSVRYAYINTIQMVVYATKMLKTQLLLEPSKIGGIGDLIIINLYGMDEGVYKGGIITGESSEVGTGSITLGNAVGFLEINYNGKIVKVPYYD